MECCVIASYFFLQIYFCYPLSNYVCFCPFLFVSVCFCTYSLFLSVSVHFSLCLSVSVYFCPFQSVSVHFCPFKSVFVHLGIIGVSVLLSVHVERSIVSRIRYFRISQKVQTVTRPIFYLLQRASAEVFSSFRQKKGLSMFFLFVFFWGGGLFLGCLWQFFCVKQ